MNAFADPIDQRAVTFALPQHRERNQSLVLLTEPDGMAAEAIRGVRTRLIAQHLEFGRRALAVCSVSPAAHGAFFAANLAVAMAQVDVRTLLIDADLRFAPIAGMFGLADDEIGLSDVLVDDALDPSEAVQPLPLAALSVMTAGRRAAEGAEYLSSQRFGAIANRFMREHDLTIFNTTPSNRSADAQRVATVAGYAVLVARKDTSYVRDMQTLSKALKADGAAIAGSVLLDG